MIALDFSWLGSEDQAGIDPCRMGVGDAECLCRPGAREGTKTCFPKKRKLAFLREVGHEFSTFLFEV